jgi:hypothetical protein
VPLHAGGWRSPRLEEATQDADEQLHPTISVALGCERGASASQTSGWRPEVWGLPRSLPLRRLPELTTLTRKARGCSRVR